MSPTEPNPIRGRRILLVIGGGIAAYKSVDLIRRLRERGGEVRVVMTTAAQEFITPLSAGAIARERGPHRQDGRRPCRRSRDGGAARDRQACADRAGDEPAYVDACGDEAEFC